MKIGITSQNWRTITGHAGKARRVLVYAPGVDGRPVEVERIDLPKEMSMHECHAEDHPFYALDALITASCGNGFVKRMAEHGVRVFATSKSDPESAAADLLAGKPLPPSLPHEHH
jgi:predicted Fe-Mo cluster-binding NifX family protein